MVNIPSVRAPITWPKDILTSFSPPHTLTHTHTHTHRHTHSSYPRYRILRTASIIVTRKQFHPFLLFYPVLRFLLLIRIDYVFPSVGVFLVFLIWPALMCFCPQATVAPSVCSTRFCRSRFGSWSKRDRTSSRIRANSPIEINAVCTVFFCRFPFFS